MFRNLSSVNNGYRIDRESIFGEQAGLRLQDFAALGPRTLQLHFWVSTDCEA
jgi:hypothetical protein